MKVTVTVSEVRKLEIEAGPGDPLPSLVDVKMGSDHVRVDLVMDHDRWEPFAVVNPADDDTQLAKDPVAVPMSQDSYDVGAEDWQQSQAVS